MEYFVHPNGLCESRSIGRGTRIWAFSHVLPGAKIGSDCNICDHTFVENEVTIGDRVTVKCGVQLWDGTSLEDDVFVGPNVTFTNDKFPRSLKRLSSYPLTRICKGASIGANSTILPGITVGQGAMVGAGAVVTRNVPPHVVVAGNPAKIIGYATEYHAKHNLDPSTQDRRQPEVQGVQLLKMSEHRDLRGSLVVTEFSELPFVPVRSFFVYNVPSSEIRGEHAHFACHQLLICLKGSVVVYVDNGTSRASYKLSDPREGLWIPPMVWASQQQYSPDAILFVHASHSYSADDYIRSYDEYLKLVIKT